MDFQDFFTFLGVKNNFGYKTLNMKSMLVLSIPNMFLGIMEHKKKLRLVQLKSYPNLAPSHIYNDIFLFRFVSYTLCSIILRYDTTMIVNL